MREIILPEIVSIVDGCDNWKPHPDKSPHGPLKIDSDGRVTGCVTHRYKVRILEFDGEHYWARPAG